jgi:hypothetical protein
MANEITFTLMKREMFRGKGPQRIRETYRMNILQDAVYVPLQGFSLAALTLPVMTAQFPGNVKNATVRTVEPRVRDEVAVGLPRGAFASSNVILDVDFFDIGLLASTKAIGIRAYGVLTEQPNPVSGLREIAVNTALTPGSLYFEVEYTPHSGGEA